MKTKKLIIGIIILILGIAIVGGIILLNNKDKKPKAKDKELSKTEIVLIDNLDFEINSELKLLSLIDKINNGKIISEDEAIGTTTLGEKEIVIKYQNENEEEKYYTFIIKIIDTEKPVIEFKKEFSTTAGTQIDLLKDVKVTDNSKEEIKATVDGKYDFNKEGTYNLKYVAVDSSSNKAEKEFILKVTKKTTSSNNSSLSDNSSSNNISVEKTQYRYRDKQYNTFYANWYLSDCSTQVDCEKLTKERVGKNTTDVGYIFERLGNYGIVKNTGWEEYHPEWEKHSLAMNDSCTEQKVENGKTYIKTCYTKIEYVAYKWSSWSNWQDSKVIKTETREVETREVNQ